MGLFLIGVVFLMQPWSLAVYSRSLTFIGIGLILYIVFSHFEPAKSDEDESQEADGDARVEA